MVSFGFLFLHPFLDGRLHRYLIHETLAACGFTPRGLIFPASAAILASKTDYMAILEDLSQRAMALTRFVAPPADVAAKTAQACGNDRFLYQYFGATEQALYLYHAIERTIDHDLQTEIDYLLAFDRAHREIDAIADFPGQTLDLLINRVVQDGGVLSKTKRESRFSYLADDVVSRYERIIRDAFQLNEKQHQSVSADNILEDTEPHLRGLRRPCFRRAPLATAPRQGVEAEMRESGRQP